MAIRMMNCGEQALVIELGSHIDLAITARVHRLAALVAAKLAGRIVEVVPTYCSVTVYFDPLVIGRKLLQQEIASLLPSLDEADPSPATRRLITVPIAYGGEFGPDLTFVAAHNGLTEWEVIAIHTAPRYLVCMLGFTPGFPYLGGMSERIAAARLDEPRLKTPAGSVGIAGAQTGIYPAESPGGWRLIGRTPLKLFDPRAESPFLFAAGDCVEFAAIGPEEYETVKKQVECGTYSPAIRLVKGADGVHGH